MLSKLYRRSDEALEYREAWDSEDSIIEHWGACGTLGETRQHRFDDATDRFRIFANLLQSARADGFEPITQEQHQIRVVQRPIDGHGSSNDLERRHALEEWLNQRLGWLGLGHCDGGSSGSGSMEAFCLVVDFEIAANPLATELAASQFDDFAISRAASQDV